MNYTVLKILILIISCGFALDSSWAISPEELSKTVVYLRKQEQVYESKGGEAFQVWYKRDPKKEIYEPKMKIACGSGFLVKYNGRDYIVTAKHVAEMIGNVGEIILNIPSGKSINLSFGPLEKIELIKGAKWFLHPSADIAIHPIAYPVEIIDQLSISPETCFKFDKPVPLLSPVYILGFPLCQGYHETITPIASKVQIASNALSIDHPQINPKLNYILLDQAISEGYSGAPVFLIEDIMSDSISVAGRPLLKVGEKVYLLGIVSFQLGDVLGGKITAIVPISYLWDVFNSNDFILYQTNIK